MKNISPINIIKCELNFANNVYVESRFQKIVVDFHSIVKIHDLHL